MSIDTQAPSHLRSPLPHEHAPSVPPAGEATLINITARRTPKKKDVITSNVDGHDPFENGLDWPVIAWFGLLHVGALAAPFFFSWTGFALFAVFQFLTGSLGVCIGYHRLLTHGSFTTSKPMRYFFAFMGQMSGEGTALQWVATHRKHHAFSDQDEDPHSPRHGGLWSHIYWMCPQYGRKYFDELMQRWCPDLLKDRGMVLLHKLFLAQHIIQGVIFAAIGYAIGGAYMATSLVLWGMFFRLVWVLHITWFVNSATHIWGYTNYKTTDDSKNLWWVGVLAFGEGWHNNHHAYQRMAKHGHRWWEFDISYIQILALEKLGLVWNVVHDVPGRKLHAEVVEE